MGFLGMGWQEILVIAVIAVMIFGPDKLPEMAGQAGKLMRDLRRMTTDMTGEFEKQTGVSVKDLKSSVDKEIAGLKSEMAGTTASVTKELNSVKSSVNKTATSISKSVGSTTGSKSTSASKPAAKSASTSKPSTTAKSATSKSTASAKKDEPEVVESKATKHDPLAGVSMMDDVPASVPAGAAGANGNSTAAAAATGGTQADALMRARARRQSAGYNQGPPSLN